jgi:pimeloyl-ACP methyl ester carboxylesterase
VIRSAVFILLLAVFAQETEADPFLEPQPLPPDLGQLNFKDSKSGNLILVRLDENKLPVRQDFFADEVSIPFFIEGFLVESPSGSRLHAWKVMLKAGSNGVSVLLLHGNGGNILTNLGAGIALVRQGFKVTIVDYSGYGFSTGEATRENLLMDAEAALDVAASMARSADEKLVLYGQSLGGHLAVVVASRNIEALDALVIEGAFSSHKAIAAEHKGMFAKAFVSEPYSASESIPDYTKPLLVIHSKDDEVVPYGMGQALYGAANEPKAFLDIEKPHLAGLAFYSEQIAEGIMRMLDGDGPGVASP